MDRKKLNEILDKHVQKFFTKAPTARFDDVPSETFIDAMEEAINYSQCCTQLKDKEALSFEDWLEFNYTKTSDDIVYKIDRQYYRKDDLLQIYNDYSRNI